MAWQFTSATGRLMPTSLAHMSALVRTMIARSMSQRFIRLLPALLVALLLGISITAPEPAGAVLPARCSGVERPFEPLSPPMQEPLDNLESPGSINMRNGSYTYRNVDLSIGGEQKGALSFERTLDLNSEMGLPMLQFSHNWDIRLREERQQWCGANTPADYNYSETIAYDGHGETFFAYGGADYTSFSQVAPSGYATLEPLDPNFRTFVYTATDGTIVNFFPLNDFTCASSGANSQCAFADRIIKPDGVVYDLSYETLPNSTRLRLKSVVSSAGFALLFEHISSGAGTISAVCGLNLAEMALPADGLCPAGVPTARYTYSGGVQVSAQLPNGELSRFQMDASQFSFWRPGDDPGGLPFVKNLYHTVQGSDDRAAMHVVDRQEFIDGRTIDYSWLEHTNSYPKSSSTPEPHYVTSKILYGGSWDAGNDDVVNVLFGLHSDPATEYEVYSKDQRHASAGPESITDQLGRVTRLEYCPTTSCRRGAVLKSIEEPGGNVREFSYDWAWRISRRTRHSKDGSVSETTDFAFIPGVDCANAMALCNKPVQQTDPRQNSTDFEYSPVHGGMTRKLLPATPGGIRPETRYSYVEGHAWVQGAAGWEEVSDPVWLLSSEYSCRTSAMDAGGACAAGPLDKVLTSYEYEQGSAGKGSNLLLLGTAVTADDGAGNLVTLRSCYSYDDLGRKLSETSPRAGLASCQ